MVNATTVDLNLEEIRNVAVCGLRVGDVVYAVPGSRRLLVGRIAAIEISISVEHTNVVCVLNLVDTDSGDWYLHRFSIDDLHTDVDCALVALRGDILKEREGYFAAHRKENGAHEK